MPAVLVHGVPDTHRLWDRLRSHLKRRDVIAVSLPGFGVPVPRGFAATKEAYVEWLISAIERLGAPVDLVGHDDPYVAPRFAERLADRVYGELILVEGCGHWWPLERPAEAAAALERFWATAATSLDKTKATTDEHR